MIAPVDQTDSEPSTLGQATAPQVPLRKLNRAVLIAAVAAAVIVGTAVLPAEYGIDVTGAGRVLGLTKMGEMKAARAGGGRAPAGPVAGDSVTTEADGSRRVQIVIGPYGGREAKAVMQAGSSMTYEWSTDGQAVDFDFHGDPANPKTPGESTSYEKGTKAGAKGSFKANFAGHHGWFWKNLTAQPVVITARIKGAVDSFYPLSAAGQGATTSGGTETGISGATDGAPYYTALPMKQFMSDVLSHSANEIWKRQGYLADDKGFHSLFPKNDEEWKQAENGALALAEMTNLLLIPGRRVEQQAWTESVARVRQSALKLARLSRSKNEEAYMNAGLELSDACNSCHKTYAPDVQ